MTIAAEQPLAQADSRHARFQSLLVEHRRIVFKVAASYCAHPEDRRDLEQEISAQLWRAFPRYDEDRPFSTWMYRVALNVAISFARKLGPQSRKTARLDDLSPEQLPAADGRPEPDDRVRLLQQLIAELDELDRALLLLYLDERSYRDIAEVLGISETNVATKLNRLKQRLQHAATDREAG